MTGAMLGFPGEDYTTPADDQGDRRLRQPRRPRPERLERLDWALDRTRRAGAVGPDAPRRLPPRARRPRPQAVPRHPGPGRPARRREGGHARLRDRPGDRRPAPPDARRAEVPRTSRSTSTRPTCCSTTWATRSGAVEILGPDIRSVHVKDANRPTVPGTVGRGGPARARARSTSAQFVQTLKEVGYTRPARHRARGRRPAAAVRRRRPRHPLPPRGPGIE